MPESSYFSGHGEEVMDSMVKQYGPKKGKSVFYATANKRKMKPEMKKKDVKPKSMTKAMPKNV